MGKYIIFGTGSIAKKKYYEITEKHGSSAVECFIDSMLSKESFCGKRVIKPIQLNEIEKNEYTYILGTMTNKSSMIGELKKQGVALENIIIERDYGPNSFEQNVSKAERILLYPGTDNEMVIKEMDEKFTSMTPNICELEHKPQIVSSLKGKEFNSIEIISEVDIRAYDLVLVWDKNRIQDNELKMAKNVYCIDKSYFMGINDRILLRLNYILLDDSKKIKYKQVSADNYRNYIQEHKSDECSYIFGKGPSCNEGADVNFSDHTVRIVCNNFVKARSLMEKIKPNMYVLADENTMEKEYMDVIDDICQYILTNECVLAVPDILGAVIIKRHPEIINKIIMLSFDTDKINYPSPENLTAYRKAYNVITALAVPIASYITDKIYITGCDGVDLQAENDWEKNWQHSTEIKDEGNALDIEFNEKQWYKEYYLKHISYMEELLQYGEGKNKQYISYTESYIPALKKRYQRII